MLSNDTDNLNNVMIVAGEASGDLHGSNLIKAASKMHHQFKFYGVGGAKMQKAGCNIIVPAEDLSVMGIVEVVKYLPRIWRRFQQLKQIIHGNSPPDLLILIDFPDFNLRLAKVAKDAGVPVLYYISPKVWAWRSSRAKVIADRVDRLALIFPFETEIYKCLDVSTEYVGNPLLDEFVENKPKGTLRKKLGIEEHTDIVGIFPGSRNSELSYILDSLIETASLLYEQKPNIKFILPLAPSLSRREIEQKLSAHGLPISIVEENIYEVAAACNAILTVSGTVTLQIAIVGTPMAILYKVAPLSYAIGKHLINVKHVGLPNIVAGRSVVREFIQADAEPIRMCNEIVRLLEDKDYITTVGNDLLEVRKLLGQPGCSARVAVIAADMTA